VKQQKKAGTMWDKLPKPTFAALVLIALTLFFFAAATNTLSGWLYVISGLSLGLMSLAAALPGWELRNIQVQRDISSPVSVGEELHLAITLQASGKRQLLEIIDELPKLLVDEQPRSVVEELTSYRWVYTVIPKRRGLYRWQQVALRTATPLGLFWRKKILTVPGEVTVYPRVLALRRCPLLDQIGRQGQEFETGRSWRDNAHEGITKSAHPYRWGDPIKNVHWRTSARLGSLYTRELEKSEGEESIVLVLDNRPEHWQAERFEQAVEAAAALFCYSKRRGMDIAVSTGAEVLLQQEQAVLQALAEVTLDPGALPDFAKLAEKATVLWLTAQPSNPRVSSVIALNFSAQESGIWIHPDRPLDVQLEQGNLSPSPSPHAERGTRS
jgi:uncharacterized protein (DUF58 family)